MGSLGEQLESKLKDVLMDLFQYNWSVTLRTSVFVFDIISII